jgi:hypothetical protein
MSEKKIMIDVAAESKVSVRDAMSVVEEFLLRLHKLEYERSEYGVDFVEEIRWEMSDRALFHLLGFIESFSKKGTWQPGDIGEYLGRMPPCETWQELSQEMENWKRPPH